MEFNFKEYRSNKIKNLLKKNYFFLFSINMNQNSKTWKIAEQNLHRISITYHKLCNNSATKIFQKSTLKNFKNVIGSTFFFLKPKKLKQLVMIKSKILDSLNLTQFTVLMCKLNKKIYAISQIKRVNSFSYKKNVTVMYQFFLTTSKNSTKLFKKHSEQCDSNT